MTTPKPDWVKSQYGVDYEDIVRSWGHEVVAFDTTGSYQGDHEALLRDSDGRYGITVIGYGSCSGCDHLEAIQPYDYADESGDWSEVVKYRDELAGEVTWFDAPSDAAAWIDARLNPDGTHWWSHDEEIRAVLTRYRAVIAS